MGVDRYKISPSPKPTPNETTRQPEATPKYYLWENFLIPTIIFDFTGGGDEGQGGYPLVDIYGYGKIKDSLVNHPVATY